MNAAATGPRDAIVILELSNDVLHEVEDVVACLRAGALAWQASPGSNAVDVATRGRRVQHVLDVADEIAQEAERVHTQREAFYRAEAKAGERAVRAKERGHAK